MCVRRCTHKLAEYVARFRTAMIYQFHGLITLFSARRMPRWLSSAKMETVKALLSEDPVSRFLCWGVRPNADT